MDNNPSAPLDAMMADLTSNFEDLSLSTTTLYNFVTKNCSLSFKKAHMHSKKRNEPETIQARYEWTIRWGATKMDFINNCIFIDESAFHINLKRINAWSKKGTRAEVIVPQTRAKTITILGAISALGAINIKVRRPQVPSKKGKLQGQRRCHLKLSQCTITIL